MALLDPLLEVQDLDLQADRLSKEREELPERAALLACGAELRENERLVAGVQARLDELARDERAVAGEVSTVAAGAKDVEERLYSGSVTAPKELESLQDELRLTREKQAGFEERELEIMEQIEGQEGELAGLAERRADAEGRAGELQQAIADAEKRIDGEIEVLTGKREAPLATLPAVFSERYADLRGKPRLNGKAAVALENGLCLGCRVSLPRVDLSRILAEAEDALVPCPHCSRLLVR